MGYWHIVLTVALAMAAGWTLHDAQVTGQLIEQTQETVPIFSAPQDVPSPARAVALQDIRVLRDHAEINVGGLIPATFTDTNSMDPVIDAGTTALEVNVESVDDVHVGDIVSYETPLAPGTFVIHRVVEIGTDEDGTYFIMKGDNNPTTDPEKVRFAQLRRKVVAIVY
jgi:signal peptidase